MLSEGVVQILTLAVAFVAALALSRLVRRWLLRDVLVGPGAVKRRLDACEDLLILDVRTPTEFRREHIRGAVNLPLAEIAGRLAQAREELSAHGNTPVVVVCRTDNRSAMARRLLSRAGLARIEVLRGGMRAWIAEGLPVAGGR